MIVSVYFGLALPVASGEEDGRLHLILCWCLKVSNGGVDLMGRVGGRGGLHRGGSEIRWAVRTGSMKPLSKLVQPSGGCQLPFGFRLGFWTLLWLR